MSILSPEIQIFSIACSIILGISMGVLLWRQSRLKSDYQNLREEHILALHQAQKTSALESENHHLTTAVSQLKSQLQESEIMLRQEKEGMIEKVALLEKARQQLTQTFDALSAQALERNNRSFLDLAHATLEKFQNGAKEDLKHREQAIDNLVKPIQESLGKVDLKLQDFEKDRVSSFNVLRTQVTDLITSQKELRSETANLVKALRAPHVRGRWGEMQLRRVVEMSGMSSHCDFTEQTSFEGEQGKLRPDMIVTLPGGKRIIVDAKAPLAAYLDALEAKDDASRVGFLVDHARQVKKHITALSKRDYWDQGASGETPEFVVLFLPGDAFFSAALEHDPSLIEYGVENKVILATPATLIALLHAVAYGWRQEKLSQNARDICDLGRDLYKRLADMGKHLTRLGSDLTGAVDSYNKTIGTIERRVLPAARKFKTLNLVDQPDDVDVLNPLIPMTRHLVAPEFTANSDEPFLGDSQELDHLVK